MLKTQYESYTAMGSSVLFYIVEDNDVENVAIVLYSYRKIRKLYFIFFING